MIKLSPLLALLSALLLLSSIPAGAGAERISFGSASFELPEGFSTPSSISQERLSDPNQSAWLCENEKGDFILFSVLDYTSDDWPFYITGGDLIDLINEELTYYPDANKKDVISVGAGECAAVRVEGDNDLFFIIFNRYELLFLNIVADDPLQYEDKLLLSLRIKETPLR